MCEYISTKIKWVILQQKRGIKWKESFERAITKKKEIQRIISKIVCAWFWPAPALNTLHCAIESIDNDAACDMNHRNELLTGNERLKTIAKHNWLIHLIIWKFTWNYCNFSFTFGLEGGMNSNCLQCKFLAHLFILSLLFLGENWNSMKIWTPKKIAWNLPAKTQTHAKFTVHKNQSHCPTLFNISFK